MPRAPSAAADEVTVLTNIPNHHNDYLFDELRSAGVSVTAAYKGLPASEGRPWDLVPGPPDRVSTSLWKDRLHHDHPWSDGSLVILSGSWATPRDAMRRALAVIGSMRGVRVVTWGETMSGRGGWRGVARRAYYAAVGLDAILAIGSRAVHSYRAATNDRVPIFVFPYTTSAGFEVAASRPPDRQIIGAVARLIPYKGLDLLVSAVARIPAAERPLLEIVGSGPLRRDLNDLAARLGVDVAFLGERTQPEVQQIRSRWSLSVLPSRSLEGWGLAVPESLNQGIPALVSEHVGAADLVRPGWSGDVVPADQVEDPDAWATHISELLDQDPDASSQNARAVGGAFASGAAAIWFREVILDGDLVEERSFVDDTWAVLEDPDDDADAPVRAD